jgi:hypothetical protein
MIGKITASMVVTSAKKRGRTKKLQQGNREWISVIQAICANGWAIPPIIVFAGKYHLSNWYQDSIIPREWAIATNPNKWTTNEISVEFIRYFEKHTRGRKQGTYRLLMLNGHESHHSADFKAVCKKHNIITLCMPPHSSHLLQPLNIALFGPLKRAYGKQIENIMRTSLTRVSKENFIPAFKNAFFQVFGQKNIRSGFRKAGLVPYDPEQMIAKLDVKLRTPTPDIESLSLPKPWVSQTPHNPTEARSQSTFLKDRIAKHQGSSPTSIYAAIDHLEKSTKTIMHKLALQDAKLKLLREANKELTNRRKTKKKQLRKKGLYSF